MTNFNVTFRKKNILKVVLIHEQRLKDQHRWIERNRVCYITRNEWQKSLRWSWSSVSRTISNWKSQELNLELHRTAGSCRHGAIIKFSELLGRFRDYANTYSRRHFLVLSRPSGYLHPGIYIVILLFCLITTAIITTCTVLLLTSYCTVTHLIVPYLFRFSLFIL